MDNVWDMFHFVTYIALPVVAGALLTWLVVSIAIRLYLAGAVALEDIRERRLETEAKGYRVDLVQPDPINGLLPVTKAAIENDAGAILAIHAARVETQRPAANVPTHVHYAPTYAPRQDYRNQTDVQATGGVDVPQLVAKVSAPPPDLWQLWHADQLPASGLLLGFDAAQPEPTPVVADWPGLASTLIGGQSQSGKSTLVRGLLLQSALQGGRFVVCDPHAGAGEKSLAYSLRPLHRLMLCEPAATDSQISDALAFVESIALGRLHGDSDRTPVVLVIDELTALLNRSGIAARLTQVLQMLATETNKVNIFAVCIGQLFHSRQFDTTARNAFVSFISTRNRQENAKAQSGNTEFARLAAGLVVGEAVWQSAAGEILRLAVPNATQRHVELVARQLESGVFAVDGPENRAPALLPPVEPGPPSGPGPGPQSETIRAAGDDGDADVDRAGPDDNSDVALTVDPVRAALVRRLFTEGKNRGEIIRAVWDIEAKQGTRAFKTAARELDEILRALVRGKL